MDTEERFKKLIAFLIALITTLIAILSFLQSDAGARDAAANRDTKRYSLEAFGRQVSGDARVNYDYNKAYQGYYELDLLANAAEAVGDEAAMNRYRTLRDSMTELSPLLAPPYYNPDTDAEPNIAKYEADTYVVETTALRERFTAASAVKDAWDSKANTYVLHLTMLAVALFLYGLSTTVSNTSTRWIFTIAGSGVAIFATGWALVTFLKPVPDLRACKTADGTFAIDAYAQGVGLAYQNLHSEAIGSFDKALSCASNYANAYAARGESNVSLGNYEAAAADYEKARANGDATGNSAGELAWIYYLLGRFDDAAAMNRTALTAAPGELWIQFDLGLSLLGANKIDEARAEYKTGMDLAAQQVAAAKAAGAEPPSYLWWGLDDAAGSLDDLRNTIESGEGQPAPGALASPEVIKAAAAELSAQLKSLSVALEYTGQPPQGALTATISEFTFQQPIYDDRGNIEDYVADDTFPFGTDEVGVQFDYAAMEDGQDIVFKVYVNGEEDPAWRIIEQWSLGSSGTAEIPISLAYSNTQVLTPGEYTVELYVNSNLAMSGNFVIEEQ